MAVNVKLQVVKGKPAGKQLLFGVGEYFFGRGPECQVRFNSDWVSRQHCRLSVSAGGVTLRDLGSRNGTLVNGALIQEAALADGDHIQIGPVTFEARIDSGGDVQPGPQEMRDPDSPDGTFGSTALYPAVPSPPTPP